MLDTLMETCKPVAMTQSSYQDDDTDVTWWMHKCAQCESTYLFFRGAVLVVEDISALLIVFLCLPSIGPRLLHKSQKQEPKLTRCMHVTTVAGLSAGIVLTRSAGYMVGGPMTSHATAAMAPMAPKIYSHVMPDMPELFDFFPFLAMVAAPG